MLNTFKRFEIITEPVIIIAILAILNISCSSRQFEDSKKILVAETLKKSSSLKLSDYAVSIEYIPLETSQNSLLTGYERITFTAEYIIVFAEECLLFNRKGEFIKKIGNIGKGPGEYLNAYAGYLFPGNQLIYFPSTAYEKIIAYSLENELSAEIVNTTRFLSVKNINDELFAAYRAFLRGDSEWNIFIFDWQGDSISCIINNFRYEGTSRLVYNDECHFYYFNSQLHFKEAYSDTIFRFNDVGKITPKFILDNGIYTVPASIRKDSENFRELFFKEYFAVNSLFETDGYLFFKYHHNNRRDNLMIYDKQIGATENFPETERFKGIENDLDGGPSFIPDHNDNNLLLQKINSFELKAYIASEEFINSTPKYPEKKKALEELAASLDENDNPVLMLVKLKE